MASEEQFDSQTLLEKYARENEKLKDSICNRDNYIDEQKSLIVQKENMVRVKIWDIIKFIYNKFVH